MRSSPETRRAYRVLETSHPPTWYVPPGGRAAGNDRSLRRATRPFANGRDRPRTSTCSGLQAAAWCYEHPTSGYEAITDYLAFSPSRLHCEVDGELVRSQEGGFYAGWITSDVVGPFKGGAGTLGW